MKQLFLHINTITGTNCLLPVDNISLIYQDREGTTIELKHNEGKAGSITVSESVEEVKRVLEGSR